MKRSIFLLIVMLVLVFSTFVFADNCPGGICSVSGYTYVSTRGYNLEQKGGKLGYGSWSYVTSKKNEASTSYVWNTTIYLKEDKVSWSTGLKNWFGFSNSSGSTISESIRMNIPPRCKGVVEKRSCTQYTYYDYDIKCEFWDEVNDVFKYTYHARNLSGDKKDTWEEHRTYITSI